MSKKHNTERLKALAIAAFMCLSVLSALPIFSAENTTQSGDLLITPPTPLMRGITPSSSGAAPLSPSNAIIAGADYLVHAQADITEDNAGNGDPDVPDDPDDGGWDWATTSFTHSTSTSPTNIYGATAQGLYYAYLDTNDVSYFTALTDCANQLITNDTTYRTASDICFLLDYQDLPGATPTIYAASAKAKYDGRIAVYGSATGLATYIRDARAGSYPNGIIAWDIGKWVVAADMLNSEFPGNGYDTDADDIAEVIWQDSFNDAPGYFDIIDDQGFDSGYADVNYYWYTLGISGLIDAFDAAQVHTSELPTLLGILADCQYPSGAYSFSYGANTNDEDWQSTAYAVMSLASYNQAAYYEEINNAFCWTAATQDPVSGGWVYGSGSHYPEIGGENLASLYFANGPVKNIDTGEIFCTIQAAIDDADTMDGHTLSIQSGIYNEALNVNKELSIIGSSMGQVTIDLAGQTGYNNAGIYVTADNVKLQGFTLEGNNVNPPRYGLKVADVAGAILEDITVQNSYRTGFDLLGTSDATLENIYALNNGGHGIQLCDCNGVDLTDITTSGNAWQSISICTWGRYTPLGTNDIVFYGTNSYGTVFQIEEGDYNNPGVPPSGDAVITYSLNIGDGADVTLLPQDFCYAMCGDQDDGPDINRIWFFKTITEAQTAATYGPIGHFLGTGVFVEGLCDPTQLYVYSPGGSIQNAVEAADLYDTVNVAAGTYEELVHIDKPLTVLGATQGVCKNGYTVPTGYGWDDSVESIIQAPNPFEDGIVLDIDNTDDVTVDGFIIQSLYSTGSGGGGHDPHLLRINAHNIYVENINILNNVIGPNTHIVSQDGTKGRMGLYLACPSYSNGGIINSEISCNKIFGAEGNGNNIFVWGSAEAYNPTTRSDFTGTVIENNEICNGHRSGIEIAGAVDHLTIQNNDIYGHTGLSTDDPLKLKYGNGIICIRMGSDKTSPTGQGTNDLVILGNTIHDNEKNGIYFGPIQEDVTIDNNEIYDNGWDGICIDLEESYYGGYPVYDKLVNLAASCNDFTNNFDYGIEVAGTPTNGFFFQATCNWWGDVTGPNGVATGIGDAVSDYVDYNPWLGLVVADADGPYDNTEDLENYTIEFDGSASYANTCCGGESLSYLWDFGDGTTSTEMSPTHTYADWGTYDVELIVTGSVYGGTNTDTTIARVYGIDVDAGGPYEGIEGMSLTLEAIAVGGTQPYIYTWDLGDGTTLTGRIITHTYTSQGTYQITLYVQDQDGAYAEDTTTALIYPSGSMVADAGGPYSSQVDTPIQFNGAVQGGTAPYTWTWDFGDGDTSTEQNPTHSYSALGAYTATLTVMDSLGQTDSDTATVNIIEETNHHPNIPNIEGPAEGKYNVEYIFNLSAYDPDGDDVKFIICWGDETENETTVYVGSQEVLQVNHTWVKESCEDNDCVETAYLIEVKAIDSHGAHGEWGTMDVTMPYTLLDMVCNFVYRLMDQYPLFNWLFSLPIFNGLFA